MPDRNASDRASIAGEGSGVLESPPPAGWGGLKRVGVDTAESVGSGAHRPDQDTAASGLAGETRLPCLSSNNSIREHASDRLSSQQNKAAAALGWNVKALAEKHGLDRIGFLTLTFGNHVTCLKEAQRRFNSLTSNALRVRYPVMIRVIERMKSRRIHYHLLVVLADDIRTGFDFDAIERRDYRSASPAIRKEWAFLRKAAKTYGFGRTELFPIKSTEEAIGRYMGKYISKHLEAREEGDKGARLVTYSTGARMAVTRFSWVTPGAQAWRRKVKAFAWIQFQMHGIPPTMKGLAIALGPRWAFKWREFILMLPD